MQKYELKIESLPEIRKSAFKFKLDKYIKKRDSILATLEENLKNGYFEQKWKQANPFYEEYNIISQIIDMPHVTEKWVISYELINRFTLIPETSEVDYVHFDAAALPGEFIIAASHYVKSRCLLGDKYKWLASSIRYEEDKTDYYQLFEKNKEKWLDHTDIDSSNINDGDLNNIETIKLISNKLRNSVNLYSLCPSNRDTKLGGILCGLLCLCIGGHLVISLHTIESEYSACIAALIAAHFEETYITVPQSDYFNDYIYLVAKNYRGIDDDIIKDIYKFVAKNTLSPFLSAKCIMSFLKNYQSIVKTILKKKTDKLEKIYNTCSSDRKEEMDKNIEKWYILNPIVPIF
jgi:hypothetical protein